MRKAIKEVAAAPLKLLLAVEQEGHGPGVYEMYVHHGAEAARLDVCSPGAELRDEFFVEGFGDFGRGGPVERGTPALTAVAVEGELGDDEERAACICDGEVHLAVRVLEYAERQYFLREILCVYFGIVLARAEEDENPLPYPADCIAGDIDPGFFYTLD